MTPKERAAMQQALEALESCNVGNWSMAFDEFAVVEAITALREALDHSGEANEMVVGWDRVKPEAIASDPLYQQGFVDGVEEGRNQVAEQAEQEPDEPVAFIHESVAFPGVKYLEWKFHAPGYAGEWSRTPLYAAPVRTKDLTDDEIVDASGIGCALPNEIDRFRAVIAADREKNRV